MLTAERMSATFCWVEIGGCGDEASRGVVVLRLSFLRNSDGWKVSTLGARIGDGVTKESGDTDGIGTIEGGAGI